MRYVKMVIGVLLALKGLVELIQFPAALAALNTHSTKVVASSAFAKGEAAGHVVGAEIGLVVGALVVFIAGIWLVSDAWKQMQKKKLTKETLILPCCRTRIHIGMTS